MGGSSSGPPGLGELSCPNSGSLTLTLESIFSVYSPDQRYCAFLFLFQKHQQPGLVWAWFTINAREARDSHDATARDANALDACDADALVARGVQETQGVLTTANTCITCSLVHSNKDRDCHLSLDPLHRIWLNMGDISDLLSHSNGLNIQLKRCRADGNEEFCGCDLVYQGINYSSPFPWGKCSQDSWFRASSSG